MTLASTIIEVFSYFKNPTIEKKPKNSEKLGVKKFFHLLFLIFTIRCLGSLICWLSFHFKIINSFGINLSQEIDKVSVNLQKSYPSLFPHYDAKLATYGILAITMCFLSPLIKELIFRAPLTLVCKNNYFKPFFYTVSVLFAYFHISSFGETNNYTLLLSPILLLGMFFYGMTLGYVRVKYSLFWSIIIAISFESLYFLYYFVFWEIY